MICPARTSLFFNNAIDLICALIFAPTSAFSRGQIVPTAVTGVAIVPFSALATLTLTVGGTSASCSPSDLELRTRQTIRIASAATTNTTPITMSTVFRWWTTRSRRCWDFCFLFTFGFGIAHAPDDQDRERRHHQYDTDHDEHGVSLVDDSLSSLLGQESIDFFVAYPIRIFAHVGSSTSGCLFQSREGGLVIEDCLVKRRALLDQCRLCIGHFHDRCFTGTVTRDRRRQIILRFRDAFAS